MVKTTFHNNKSSNSGDIKSNNYQPRGEYNITAWIDCQQKIAIHALPLVAQLKMPQA